MSDQTRVPVDGMHCASCASTIESSLQDVDGVTAANVNYATEEAAVQHDGTVTPEEVAAAVEQAGYEVATDKSDAGLRVDYKREAAKAWLVTFPIVAVMADQWGGVTLLTTVQADLLLVLCATPVVLYFGRHTLASALTGVQNGVFNMDSLIAVGTLAAYATGLLTFVTPVANYAGVGAMIMASHLIGTHLEHRAKGDATAAIENLLSMQADTATRLTEAGRETVPVGDLEQGERVLVRPGEKVPIDGVVVAGESTVNEALATGESRPIMKTSGDEVIGGTVNGSGALTIEVTATGAETFLSQVVDLVKEAQGTTVPIQSLADRMTHYFVPTVLALAGLTFLAWVVVPDQMLIIASGAEPWLPWVDVTAGPVTLALFAAIAVLVIACPCALGLATPTALLVGTGTAAEQGVLYRDGAAIQMLTDIDTVVLDKTGTITEGEPTVTAIHTTRFAEDYILQHAASVEQQSEHPIAEAIYNAAVGQDLTVPDATDFESVTGEGVAATVDGTRVRVGTPEFAAGSQYSGQFEEQAAALEDAGETVVYVSIGDDVVGCIAVADPIKPTSAEAIDALQARGIDVWMLTGDSERTATAIADAVGIDRMVADLQPQEKLAHIEHLQTEGRTVSMVGDGINDAPALTQSDVGVAIGTGTDIAIESSDVSLVHGDLTALVTALDLSADIFTTIKQNLGWAFAYNTVAIPVAIFGLLHPVIAVAAMFASSLSVILNAARLR